MKLQLEKVRDVKTPTGSKTDAGYDFYLPNDSKDIVLKQQEDVLLPTGIKANIPENFALIAFNKSGIARKQKLVVGACVVDPSYTGEIFVHLYNYSNDIRIIKKGQKIIQFVLLPYIKPDIEIVDKITKVTERGSGAFGSTGI